LSMCVGVGLRSEWLMTELLAIMSNLMSDAQRGPAEIGYRAMVQLSKIVPESALDKLLANVGN